MIITGTDKEISIPVDSVSLEGHLSIPEGAQSLVIFVHGSGSSRLSPRNQFVAGKLRESGIGFLLFDLLTREEDINYETRFDIGLLVRRLKAVTMWLRKQPETASLVFGYFGASTGAAAALEAAADPDMKIGAIVSRGGRPDMAKKLALVHSPTLLIVGGSDYGVIELNESAFQQIKAVKNLKIVTGATHLFEEPGKLEEVARLAAKWFKKHLI
ncbi:MAG: dienelactone hydrolase family protein [Nitrospiraceae bacterium]|nr:dienelactone hydrolase family protein [Nitrospiraceae bacterium]MDA8091029.1 dienelactone hydrolase family protein [Nitrospiraceae bacterium]